MRPLPCFPCPHQSACCAYGVSLDEDEANTLRQLLGAGAVVWDDEENEWRTAVVNDRCVLLRDNACTVHDKPYYPKVCGGFPFTDPATGGPYLYENICPEFDPQRESGE